MEQYAKYAESVLRAAPLVSSERGWGNTEFHHSNSREGQQRGDTGLSPAPWHAETDPPRTEIVTGWPAMAFCRTRWIRAPVPVWILERSRPVCPHFSAIVSLGPKTGQNGNGGGSEVDAFR
jgi:hypothetical protein